MHRELNKNININKWMLHQKPNRLTSLSKFDSYLDFKTFTAKYIVKQISHAMLLNDKFII